ncbi:MAG: hypothetical protein FJZ01_10370 [Candidatus Sericytochromatia bacterium]|nr:hypothetical protein [Candidatus Tanganyikabacteria bacterium]
MAVAALVVALAAGCRIAGIGSGAGSGPADRIGPDSISGPESRQAPGSAGKTAATGTRLEAGDPVALLPGSLTAGRGLVELRVAWPPAEPASVPAGGAYRTQLIPTSVSTVAFEMSIAGADIASISVNRAAGASTATASLELDAGAYTLAAAAFSGAATETIKVAAASASLVVVAGAKVAAALTLGPMFVPVVR